MNIDQCIEQGLLVKTLPDSAKFKASIEMALHKIELAETEFDHHLFESAIISAYTAMFHASRAILFWDGFKERSHFAVYVYVNERYGNKIERKYLSELNALRLQRHELMYGLAQNKESQESTADTAIKMAKGFIQSIQNIFSPKKPR